MIFFFYRLQLIKFWPSCAPGKGVCGGAKMFGSALLQPARSVCVSLSAFSFLLFLSFLSRKLMLPIGEIKVNILHCDAYAY